MISWKNSTWRGRMKLVLFSTIPLLILLLLAQTYAFITIHRSIAITTDSLTGQTYYSMQIGLWPGSHKSLTPINSLGLPDAEFVDVLPKGNCVHVLLAGDSYTFGDATSETWRWSTQLKGITSRRLPDRCIRFFNIGVRNTTIDTTIVRIQQVLPLIQPDVVILGQYQNDLTDLANPGSPAWVPRSATRAHDSHWGERLGRIVPGYNVSLLRYLTYNAFAFMIRNDIKYDVLSTWSALESESTRPWANKLEGIYHDLYGSLVRDMRARNIDFAVLIFPSKMDVMAKRSPEGEFFAGLAREFQVPALSLMPALDANRKGMPFYLYDGHMNELGNRVVADAVWKWLFNTESPPVAALAQPSAGRPLLSSARTPR